MTGCPSLVFLYRDPSLVVIDKPGGLLSVPGRGPAGADSVVARLRHLLPGCITQPAVHRLDMDTSGLMVLALTRAAHRHLSAQFASQQVVKHYAALVEGVVAAPAGEIALPFRLDPHNRPRQVYDPIHGKTGISRWRKIATRDQRTLVAFQPLTGRTHQLRLHASHPLGLGCPIVGDRLYGTPSPGQGLLLHAAQLAFRHPDSNQWLQFTSPPPFAPTFLTSLE
ncbi:RluA family pseudouridine synthase [Desulfobulbus alkaliphilus]|uniref:RluA family pseudouridine synthase n=1 Tax=Desulfobulbus alkaliphilus TaxID=869814 RepID=UPI001964F77C|nr:RluA family pseudouridine synthase [Desulfobulbus alkaliphilus]MBM9536806.1 RluA family pseudouridine synthase [Desulfobulbus alkaliphilus]